MLRSLISKSLKSQTSEQPAVAWSGWLDAEEDKQQSLSQIVNKPVPLHSKLPTATPQGRRGQLDNIPDWITKIDRTAAFFPIHF
jgi:hypothetical protein